MARNKHLKRQMHTTDAAIQLAREYASTLSLYRPTMRANSTALNQVTCKSSAPLWSAPKRMSAILPYAAGRSRAVASHSWFNPARAEPISGCSSSFSPSIRLTSAIRLEPRWLVGTAYQVRCDILRYTMCMMIYAPVRLYSLR